ASTLSIDFTATQQRVSGNCATGSAIRMVNADGSVNCEPIVSAGLAGTGGINFLPKFIGPNAVGGALIFANGYQSGLGTTNLFAKLNVDGGTNSDGGLFQTSVSGATGLTGVSQDTGSAVGFGLWGRALGINGVGVAGDGHGARGIGVWGDGH